MIGIQYELFWTLNPKTLNPFIKAFELKRQYDDEMAWISGNYIRMAIADSLSKKNLYPPRPNLAVQKRSGPMSYEEMKAKILSSVDSINSRKGRNNG